MLSASEVILQPPHSSLTAPKSKNISYSIQTVVPHCSSSLPPLSSGGSGRIILVPPIQGEVPPLSNRHSDLTSSLSLTQTSDGVARSMNAMNMSKSVNSGAGGHENGGSASMTTSSSATSSAVPFIRTAGDHKGVSHDRGGHIQVTPLQMPVSSSVNMQVCSPVAVQHPNIAARHQHQQSNFIPVPKTAAAGGAPHASFYLYDDHATTYQCLGVSPPNVAPAISHVQNLGQHQHGMPMNYNQHSSSVCGVPSVVRIPQRNTAQNRSSVTNTMQYFPVNMQQEAVAPPPIGMFQSHPQSSPSQLVVSGGHSTGAPYLHPPPSSGGHSPNWPPNPSERVTFQNETLTNQPPQVNSEHQQQQHNLLIKSENSEDHSSCYRQQRSVPCVSQQQRIQTDDVIKDDTAVMSRRQPPGGVVAATSSNMVATSQLLSSVSSSSISNLYPSSGMSSIAQPQQTNNNHQSDALSPASSSVESSSSSAVGGFSSTQGTVGVGVPPSTPPQCSSQQNAQSSKSSPSPVEFSPELEMDLATLPAFNFNLDEICEDVLFPEKDDFDDIFIDDLTITPSPSCPGTSGSSDTTLHNLDQRDLPCSSKDRLPKLEPGSISCSKTSPSGGTLEDDIFNRPSTSSASNFGPGFLDNVKEEGRDGVTNAATCHGRLDGAFGGASSSQSPTNYADLPNRGANDTFENMDFKSSDGSTSASIAADGSPSRFAASGKGKQQVSPSPSYASCLGAAGVGNVRRRRRPGVDRPSSSGEACTICGDKASGYHYNALSCEGCKGFFRRSVTNDRKYTCERNGECNIDIYMRRKCQKCRLDRCYAAGMRKECLMSVEQCRSMQAKRKSRSGPSGTGPITPSGTIVLGGAGGGGGPLQNNPGIMQVAAGMGGPVNNVNVLSSNAINTNHGANMPHLPPPHPHAAMVASNSQQASLQQPYPSSVGTSLPSLQPAHSTHASNFNNDSTSRVAHQITTTPITSNNNNNATSSANYSGRMPLMPSTGDGMNGGSNNMNGGGADDSSDTQEMTSSMQQLLISIPPQYDSEQELLDVGLSPEQVTLVRNLIMDRWSVGMPNIDKIRYLPPWPGRTGDVKLTSLSRDQQRQMKFQHMTHLTRICMECVIGLAKKLRDFSQLSQQDQIRIVKPACLEILMINSAQYFDVTTDRLLMATGHWTTIEQMEDGLLKYGFGTQMWQYVRTLAQMKLHDIEFTLLTALCVYSPDRAGLTNEGRVQVSQFQQPYRNCLEIYCRSMYPQCTPSRMSQLMSKLYELRSVSFQHSKYIYGIQLNKSNWEPLPQLLGEIFDHGSEVCSEEETSPPLNNNNNTNNSSSNSSVQQQGDRIPVVQQQVPLSTGLPSTCHPGVISGQQNQTPLSCSPVSSSFSSNPTAVASSPAHSTAAVSTGAKHYATGHAPSVVSMVAPHPPVSVATPLSNNTPTNISGGGPSN